MNRAPHATLTRRHVLQRAVVVAGATAVPALALGQPGKPTTGGRRLMVAQILDTSARQQDVAKDFLIGARAAWQDINARGGVRGLPIEHRVVEVDGTEASVRTGLLALRDNPACIALCGSVGSTAAAQVESVLQQENADWAHVAPWLQSADEATPDHSFPIFATRDVQIAHALQSLAGMGITELGAVYDSSDELARQRDALSRVASRMKLKIRHYAPAAPAQDLRALGQNLSLDTPAILIFLGGTPELAQFTQGLGQQPRQRYVVALADVNLQTLMQMGVARNTPIIGTQAVPVVTSSLPVVRAYRETLARLFDEPPTPHSLAGFISARYVFEVIQALNEAPTRQKVLAAFQRRTDMDLGGYRIAFDARHRSTRYVTQSMLTTNGRVVG